MLEIVGEALHIGAVVGGAYRLERILGEGGMGVVWEGVELATGRRVALKLLQQRRETDPRNQERVLREARATMAIHHPNVAAVHAVLETDAGIPFLVMDVLVGETLRARLKRQGPMNPVQCARIMRAVVSAVAAAHAQRIVHRDLKPDNVFLLREPPDDVRVIDFGIAKHLAPVDTTSLERDVARKPSLTSTGAVLGTPVYMAPEQIFGDDDIDGRADVWSLGIVLYECLAGRRPTDGDGFGRIIRRITTDPLEPLEHARPGLPHRMTSLVARMLSRDRAARPSLAEIGAVLESLETREVNAPPSAQPALVLAAGPERIATTASNVAIEHASNRPAVVAPTRVALAWIGGGLGTVAVLAGVGFTVSRLRADTPAAARSTMASGAASQEPTHLMMAALAALKARDGKSCLSDLDAYDGSPLRGAFPPTSDPQGGMATRAMCMMLAGDCAKGKAMYASWMAVTMKGSPTATPEVLASSLDNVVGGYCEGSDLTPHDRLVRADIRMNEAAAGLRNATSADCKDWVATENELLPATVPATNRSVFSMKSNLRLNAMRCYAHVGDCKSALAEYRADFHDKGFDNGTPAENEKHMLATYDGNVDGTTCSGKR